MKNISNPVRFLHALIFVIFAMSYAVTAHSTETTIKIGKYQVGLITSPLSGAAAWRSKNGFQCRYANSSELTLILDVIKKMSQETATEYIESLTITRPLTHIENQFCEKLYALFALVVAPSKNGSRPTRDIQALKYTGNRVASGTTCEGTLIKKYQKNKGWYKITGRNETALCGEY